MYEVNVDLPRCSKRGEGCLCASCLEINNPEECAVLIKEAHEVMITLASGGIAYLSRLRKIAPEDYKTPRSLVLVKMNEMKRERDTTITWKNLEGVSGSHGALYIGEAQSGKRFIKKYNSTCYEIFVHHELSEFLKDDEALNQLIPEFLSVTGVEDEEDYSRNTYTMEYVEGATLSSALPEMREDEVLSLLAVLHGFLGYLQNKLGFIHGDLSKHNILLRGWKGGKEWLVPLFDGKGKYSLVTLSFCPVLVDFGISSTWQHCGGWEYVGPYRSTLMDVKYLYSHFNEACEGGLIDRVKSRFRGMFGAGWPDRYQNIPIPLVVSDLSHGRLLALHLEERKKSD